MASKKTRLQIVARGAAGSGKRAGAAGQARRAPAQVSGQWLLKALAVSIAAAVLCAWGALCLLFWQGAWQLLYHPASRVVRTPAAAGLAFEAVGFDATDEGVARLSGWWIPAAPDARYGRLTVLFLHGRNGNLGDSVDALARLHASGLNVFAFDYRGYGQSQFVRPSEDHLRQDVESALTYLTGTRHVAANTIVLFGQELGANLALEAAAAHPELAGVVLESPIGAPMNAVFNDARARMVPAHLLVRDRYDLDAAAAAVRIPVLWFETTPQAGQAGAVQQPAAFSKIRARDTLVWLAPSMDRNRAFADAFSRWLDELPRP